MAPITNPALYIPIRAATLEETRFLLVASASGTWSDVAGYVQLKDAAGAQAQFNQIKGALIAPAIKRKSAPEKGVEDDVAKVLELLSDDGLKAVLAQKQREMDSIVRIMNVREETRLLQGTLKADEERLRALEEQLRAEEERLKGEKLKLKKEAEEIRKKRAAMSGLAVKNVVKRERETEGGEVEGTVKKQKL